MKVVIFGATGGCGQHALTRLLEHEDVEVLAIVRSAERLPALAKGHPKLSVIAAPEGHLEMDLTEHLRGCDAVVRSLLSHAARRDRRIDSQEPIAIRKSLSSDA